MPPRFKRASHIFRRLERGVNHEKHEPHEKAEPSHKKFRQLNRHGRNSWPQKATKTGANAEAEKVRGPEDCHERAQSPRKGNLLQDTRRLCFSPGRSEQKETKATKESEQRRATGGAGAGHEFWDIAELRFQHSDRYPSEHPALWAGAPSGLDRLD